MIKSTNMIPEEREISDMALSSTFHPEEVESLSDEHEEGGFLWKMNLFIDIKCR